MLIGFTSADTKVKWSIKVSRQKTKNTPLKITVSDWFETAKCRNSNNWHHRTEQFTACDYSALGSATIDHEFSNVPSPKMHYFFHSDPPQVKTSQN
jgi:hypothetical protein